MVTADGLTSGPNSHQVTAAILGSLEPELCDIADYDTDPVTGR
jgi:hypothetical protein